MPPSLTHLIIKPWRLTAFEIACSTFHFINFENDTGVLFDKGSYRIFFGNSEWKIICMDNWKALWSPNMPLVAHANTTSWHFILCASKANHIERPAKWVAYVCFVYSHWRSCHYFHLNVCKCTGEMEKAIFFRSTVFCW